MAEAEATRSPWHRARLVAAVLVLGALGVAGFKVRDHFGRGESTDDAFVQGTVAYVSPQVGGRVAEILVEEHQRVQKGQLLVRIDEAELRVRLERARADVAAARNRVAEARAAAAAAEAERKGAKVERWRAERELKRIRSLRERGAASQQQLDLAQASFDAAAERVVALGLRAEAARALLGDEAPLRQAQAKLHDAELALEHARVLAPFDGVVGRKNVELGMVVAPGRPLLALIADEDLWVMANFKETQLGAMHVGSSAEVRIDAFPGRIWKGHVASFSPATGATYALIAPEPAAGNFTKVVQRLPVKIRLDGLEPREGDPPRLRVGLSAEVRVGGD